MFKKSEDRTHILFNSKDINKVVLNPIYMKQVLFPQVPHLEVVTSTVAVAEYKHKILGPFLETKFSNFKNNPLHGHPIYLNYHIRNHTCRRYVTAPDEVQKGILEVL